jgi:hypothetical protein
MCAEMFQGKGVNFINHILLSLLNISRYVSKCKTVIGETMVEEEHPICKIRMVNKKHLYCQEISQDKVKNKDPCRPVMRCKLGMKKMKKQYPRTECEEVAIGEEEKCVDMVKFSPH